MRLSEWSPRLDNCIWEGDQVGNVDCACGGVGLLGGLRYSGCNV